MSGSGLEPVPYLTPREAERHLGLKRGELDRLVRAGNKRELHVQRRDHAAA